MALPIPRYLLASAYADDKAGFMDHPYWAGEFVHAGPYRLREFVRGSHVLLEANDSYALGRPRIDVIEVKFIPANTTLMANILSGAVELSLGRGLSIEQGLEVRDQWRAGRMEYGPSNLTRIYPEFDHPNPAVIANVQFRRALLHATDRQQVIETFQFGLASLTDSMLPEAPENQELNAGLPRYAYDVRRAQQLIEALGYVRGGDGFFRDVGGQRLTVEFRARGTDELTRLLATIADYWARSGVASDTIVVPPQRNQDREYRFNRPGFHMTGGTSGLDGIQKAFHSSQIPTPARGYVGSNDSHYANPEMDALIDRYLVTIPRRQRMEVVRQILRLAADDLPIMNVHFTVRPILIHERILNVGAVDPRSTNGWNAEQWDVR
jgi:peptide/nickel transport system substrate-binding protein